MSEQEEPEVLAAQMGRPLAGDSQVASRCQLGLPVVIRTRPLLGDGSPFPTLYYLTCPLARARISRLEQEGWIRRFTTRAQEEPEWGRALEQAHADYAAERAGLLPPDHPARAQLQGGVGGIRGAGVKCLHAHYAHARAGGRNPVGEEVRERIEPLLCTRPCVVDGRRDPAWREPPIPGDFG